MVDDESMAAVFKAMADPTRRRLLDRLRQRNGQTLRDLSDGLDMARQSVTQHLDLLVEAGLVTVVRRGRERLHYLDPTPIHEVSERWIAAFDRPRLDAIAEIRHRAEELAMTTETTIEPTTEPAVPTYVYTTYIRATPEQVWHALTDAELTASYWGHANISDSDWKPGSTWEHRRTDESGIADVVGQVIEAERPNRLVVTFGSPGHEAGAAGEEDEVPSVVTFLVEQHQDIVRLTVTHENLPDRKALDDVSHGWPAVLANLKSLLETGEALPQAPWDMPAMSLMR